MDCTVPLWLSITYNRKASKYERIGHNERNGSNQTNLTNHPALNGAFSWSPDGRQIVLAGLRELRDEC